MRQLPPNDISRLIKLESLRLGFTRTAICDAEPLGDAGALLEKWLADRFHGTMEWMARTRHERQDPRSYFPEAQSIIVTALNYYRDDELLNRAPDEANISIYARGRDYHKVLRKKLKQLLAYAETLMPGVRGRVCVDSFPVMEKVLAVKSGIGWIGKHTNLIIVSKGSYYFLGEILLSAELPSDPPFVEEHCGTCSRCQAACPTGALDTPFVLDARRCISYLTIEHDGDIDSSLQKGMENWVFGCDICQAVCPWNRFSEHAAERDFDNRLPDELFRLENLRELSEAAFTARFAGTPVRRAGYRNFMRNVGIAMKNKVEGGSGK